MEYVYSALLLHSAGKEVTEDTVASVLKAAGVTADSAKVKALIASLKDVNIDEAVKAAAFAPMAAAPAQAAGQAAGKAEEKKDSAEDKAKSEEQAAEGLGALFG